MRFKNRFKVAGHVTLLMVAATYVMYLGAEDQLRLYIHPRYIVFTFVMATIGLILMIADAYFGDDKNHASYSKSLSSLPLLLLLGVAVFLPARTLTSATVTQRTTDAGSAIATAESKPISALFTGSSRGLRLADWSRLLATNDDPSYYVNKPVKVSGFVYDGQLGNNTVSLARFVLTCCAVDAQPVSVPVHIENWRADYKENEWIEVEGEFKLTSTDEGEQLVLIPSSLDTIEQPRNPYAN